MPVDLVKQLRQELSIVKVVARNGRRHHNLDTGLPDPNIQLWPRAPFASPMAAHLPLAFVVHLDAGGIDHQVQGFAFGALR